MKFKDRRTGEVVNYDADIAELVANPAWNGFVKGLMEPAIASLLAEADNFELVLKGELTAEEFGQNVVAAGIAASKLQSILDTCNTVYDSLRPRG